MYAILALYMQKNVSLKYFDTIISLTVVVKVLGIVADVGIATDWWQRSGSDKLAIIGYTSISNI